MTQKEMELRIIRLEEVIEMLLPLRYKFDELKESGLKQIEVGEKMCRILEDIKDKREVSDK